MATPVLESAFTTGEVAPALFGNVQLTRMHSAASTMRNGFVGYQGGWYSRAGTEYVGFSKQTGRDYPPRMIPFQFSINQGLALEFGNFYMRVIFDGAYVTESPYSITAATQASPCVLTLASISSALSAVAINTAVSASYAPGDTVSLAGGIFTTRAVLSIGQTLLSSIGVNNNGNGYTPGDQVTLSGGSAIVNPVLNIATTKVVGYGIRSAGAGGTPGAQVLTGTTGTGTKWQANVTVSGGGVVTSINSLAVAGSYTENPAYSPTGSLTDLMSGGGFAGMNQPIFDVVMGVNTVSIVNPGSFVANAPAGVFTQLSTTGTGTGATFASGIFGIATVTVSVDGSYTSLPSNPVLQFSTSGTGAGATFTVSWSVPPTLSTGDWVFVDGVVGMTELNGRTFVVSVAGSNISLFDIYGNAIDSSAYAAYISGGTASRIFTLTTQYSEVDLKWLKFTESADVMSLCCINQETGTEYPPVDLSRLSDSNWVFTPAVPVPSVSPPTGVALTATPQPTSPTTQASYQYCVTAVAPDGTESIASNIASISDQVNIVGTSGTVTVTWNGVAGVNEYFVYKATPGISDISASAPLPPAGALFGYAGAAYGNRFLDTNIVADYSQVPPLHKNPFARGQIVAVTPGAQGAGYTTATATINTFTGGGAVIQPVIEAGAVVGYIVKDGGSNYAPTDTVTISGAGGAGATATLTVGPQTGTYPGVVAYFQQRRFYAYTLNQPDTYFGSQPGAYTNFDTRLPPIDSDAITGNPWSVQVNGIQFMIAVSGGLVVLTGLEAYFLTGQGGSAFAPQPISPASQSAQPQGFNGCSPFVPPVRIYQDVIYLQAKGTTYRNFSFNISLNTYTGDDITQNSTQLFNGFEIQEHAWCEEPNRLLWSVRDDGVMLSLTWVKAEKVAGFARHDTEGTFESVCSVTEPPVDALYIATQRQIGANTAYVVERMNNRLWRTIEDTWCVDCGFSYPQEQPNATLRASSPTGLGALTGVTGLVGGSGYTAATTATVVDDNGNGPGVGAVASLTIIGGVITAIAFTSPGAGYVNPRLDIVDPAGSAGGSGASASPILDNSATFTASAAVFAVGDIGRVLRMGGGVATITGYTDSQHVTADISVPITDLLPNRVPDTARPATSGNWTISTPITVVSGLTALAGATVTGLADGVAIPPQVVTAAGTITLDTPASQITVGLAFKPQLQSVYLLEETLQGQRKKIGQATARVQKSGPFKIGSNQPDGSVQSPIQIAPPWIGMADAPTPAAAPYNSNTVPLFTGDIRIPVQGGYQKPGQVAVEQDLPYPLEILAFVPEVLTGDTPAQKAPERRGRGG